MNEHREWKRSRDRNEVAEGYGEARLAFELAEWARTRREELGLPQIVVADRAGMSQPALSKLEAGGTVPTIPLLLRLARALDADLTVGFTAHDAA